MKKNVLILLVISILSLTACSESVNLIPEQETTEPDTKSVSSLESTFLDTGIPDYIVREGDLVKMEGELKFLKMEIALKNGDVGVNIEPHVYGFYSINYGTKYESNSGCYYELPVPPCFDVSFGFAHLSVLSLYINYIPPHPMGGELIIHTVVQNNGRMYDRYISVQGISYSMLN